MDFVGVEQVDERELRGVLETRERPRVLFWRGPPRYFNRREFEADLARIEAFYRAHGSVSADPVGPRARRVIYTAAPGMLARFGPIEVTGVSTVGEDVVHRELTYAPGDLFVRRKLRESQRKLYRLDVFQFVNIESLENPEQPEPEVPTRVNVLEGDHKRVLFGLGPAQRHHD